MIKCWKKCPTDIAAVSRHLGTQLEYVGGEVYLKALYDSPEKLRVPVSEDGLAAWARLVDNAGRLRQLAVVIGNYQSKVDDLDKLVSEVEDVDAFLNDFVGDVQKAQGTLKSGYTHIREGVAKYRRHLENSFRGKTPDIIPMGWPTFYQWALPPREALVVICGLSSIGKTQLLLQMILGQAIQYKRLGLPGCWAINSYEMSDQRLVGRLACCLAGVDSNKLRKAEIKEGTEEAKRLQEWLDFVEQLPIFIDDTNLMTSEAINWHGHALHVQHGPLIGLGIDYAELVPDKAESEELRVAKVYANANRIKKIGATSYVLSQFNRGAQHTASKIGGKGRIRYTGSAEHIADVIMEVYNLIAMQEQQVEFSVPDGMDEECAYVLLEKNRDGPCGMFPLLWDSTYTRFSDQSISGFGSTDLYEGLSEVRAMMTGDF